MQEETRVIVKEENLHYVHTMHRMNWYVDIFFTASIWDGMPEIKEKDKCDDLSWFPIDKLPENMVPSIKHTIEQWQAGIPFSEFPVEEK